jgi:hypothetical protein
MAKRKKIVMKIGIKNIIAAVLMIPILSMGVSLVMPAISQVGAVSDITGPADKRCLDPVANKLTIEDAAKCTASAGGNTCLFGQDDKGKPCVFNVVINFALYFIGALSVLMLIIGGIRYTMSGGNDKSVTAAKNTILYAIIGLVIAVLAYAIIQFVFTTFK